MAQDLQKIQDNVRLLLTKHAALRGPFRRKQAHIQYWLDNNEIGKFIANTLMKEYPYWTSAESISRAIRAIQDPKNRNYDPNLKPLPELEQKRFEMADDNRRFNSKVGQ